ncbi:MAG: AglZ/HisF2 family acetamidino modification protein [Thermoplasmata archaeon]
MLRTRVIPFLLLRNSGLYKGINFKDHKYVGDPINTVKIFNEKEVDELALLDITTSLENKEPNYSLIKDIVSEAFMPISYGGGVKTLEQARKLFNLGIEKIIVNTSFAHNPGIITEIASVFGSQSVVVCIDVKKSLSGNYASYIMSGTQKTKESPVELVKKAQEIGAGEIVINSIDRDGTLSGYDLKIINEITQSVSVPVIVVGGASNLEDFKKAVESGASAVGAGAMFVFNGPHRAVLITYPSYDVLKNILGE